MPRRIVLPSTWVDPGSLAARAIQFITAERSSAWLVGGAVRDRLLNRPCHDLDVLVMEDAIRLARQLANRLRGKFHVLDADRDYGRALLSVPGEDEPLVVDVARIRNGDLLADLRSRDFTVNAMAVRLKPDLSGELVDPLGGLSDLEQGLLRQAGPDALAADPVRLLRAPRLAHELGLRMVPDLIREVRQRAPLLSEASVERVRDELWRLIGVPGCARNVRVLRQLGLTAQVLPELEDLAGVEQGPPHRYSDVLEHTLQAVHAVDRFLLLALGEAPTRDVPEALLWDAMTPHLPDLRRWFTEALGYQRTRAGWLRWIALMHDWGKPYARTVDESGRVRFIGHDKVGQMLARRRLNALRFSRREVHFAATLVRQHMRPLLLLTRSEDPSRRAVYRLRRDLADGVIDAIWLALADHRATYGPDLAMDDWQRVVRRAMSVVREALSQQAVEAAHPLIDGRTVIEQLGIAPGPLVGRILAAIREAQAVGEVTTVEEALSLARRIAEGGAAGSQNRGDD